MNTPVSDAPYLIETFPIGPMDNFGYLVVDRASGEAATVDPAWDDAVIRAHARKLGARISQVWLTHTHYDHVNALDGFRDLPIHIARDEMPFWEQQFAAGATQCVTAPANAPVLHDDGDQLTLGHSHMSWYVTPGHSPGSSCLMLSHDVLAADTLFVFGCGRCDLDGSDPAAMFHSLNRLKSLIPPGHLIHPGHDYGITPSSTFAEQIAGNPFLMFDDEATFVKYRMHDHGRLRSQPFGPEGSPYPDA
jgi:glyoxylase-like metal-dependent hydrolase (beta-lactamase superfamily II)